MANYPPTPAFGVFPLPAPRGPPGLSQDLRKLSINSAGSNNITLPSLAIQSPNLVPKFASNSSASRQLPSGPPSTASITSLGPMHAPSSSLGKQNRRSDNGLPEDREEGELSDAEDLEGPHLKKRNNRSRSRQRDRGGQNQQGREFAPHSMRTNSEAPNHSPIPRSQTWNETYRRESTSHTPQGWPGNRKRSFDMSSAPPSKALESNQREKKFDPPSQPKGNPRAPPPPGPKNLSPPFHIAATSRGMHVGSSPMNPSTSNFPLETPKTIVELRNEAQRAVLNMIPLRVSWRYMVDEAGIDPDVLKKVYTVIGLPIPTETPSRSPSGDIDHPQAAIAKLKSRDKSSDRMEIDKDAQAIRKQLEKDARDRERKEAEAKAAELVRQREAAKEEEERKRRLAEVEAKKEVVRRKINEMGLPGKSASPSLPLTPISSTPVVAAIARVPPLLPPRSEVPRIPGLLLTQLDGSYSNSLSSPDIMPEQSDTIMKDSPEPVPSLSGQSVTVSTASNISTAPVTAPSPERPPIHRRKRPVASDMYSEPMPTTKRKFGDHRKMPIELIIDISDEEEEEEEEEGSADDSRTSRSTPSGTDHGSKRSTTTGNNTPPRLRPSLTAPAGSFAANGNSKLVSAKALQDKEEQIRALKEAIQKAQQKKKLAAKTGLSTPTSVGTPSIGVGPSVPPPLMQQQVADVAVAVSSALDNVKKESEITHLKMQGEKQKRRSAQAQEAQAKAKADVIKLKELQKREQKKKIDALLTEIEEIEKSEAEKKRKEAEEIEAAKRRQRAKEEKERQLKEAENERLKKMMAKEKVLQELARMRREEEEMENKKEALKAELAAMEKAAEKKVDAMGECDKAANIAISKKKEEIEQLKKAMEEIEVDQITISSISSTPESGQTSSSHEQLTDALKVPQQESREPTDVIMGDNMEPRMNENGLVSTYQEQVQEPMLDRAEIATNRATGAPLPPSSSISEDVMDVDQDINEAEKVNGNNACVDVDMDASSDEYVDEEKENGTSIESSSEADETSGEEEEDTDEEKRPVHEPQGLERKPEPSITAMPQELVQPGNAVQNHPANSVVEEANLPTPVPEQRKQAKELVDPTKITSTTATTSVIMKQEQKKTQRQPEHVFTPYKSPLTSFKSFRYHPNFLTFCPGGYRSLTFSNRIDPIKPLCRWELSGGICSDTGCTEQHKRQIEMPDDEILVELASVVEGSTGEQRDNYNRGLRQAIAAMREQGIKDFETVVAGIASYRRQFLADETRVLRLPPSQSPQASQHQHQQRGSSSFSSYT